MMSEWHAPVHVKHVFYIKYAVKVVAFAATWLIIQNTM